MRLHFTLLPFLEDRLPIMTKTPPTRLELASFLLGRPLYIMLVLLVIAAALSAATTWLVIKAGRDVANDEFLVWDLMYILAAQSASYAIGAISWIYAERAGCKAFARYMFRFAHDNRDDARLMYDRHAREQVEPFLSNEAFYDIFQFMYQLENQLSLALGLIFNIIVLGFAIDAKLSAAYVAVFIVLTFMQWSLRRPVARAYLENQRLTNRVTAHGYTAWDNIYSGNRYNLRLWFSIFKTRLRECLRAQIIAIMAREGLSAAGGIIGLAIVFSVMTMIAVRDVSDTEVLIALAATLPRQIEMTHDVHELASGWNDILAAWTRMGGIADNMGPKPDPAFESRIKFDRLMLREGDRTHACKSVDDAMRLVAAEPTGRITVRGGNGSGKSTLLASLKTEMRKHAYYWPTTDRLAFQFAMKAGRGTDVTDQEGDEDEEKKELKPGHVKRPGFSSGERQIRSLQEIVAHTEAPIYLLDEWDANLDPSNRAEADALVAQLAQRARVVEVSHRDRV
jgi:ABC-type multidrug transport system fused ATPase/permease subunit